MVVMSRMSNKLTGRDFSTSSISASSPQHVLDHGNLISGDSREVDHGLSVKLQVQKLIIQATSHENLCQNYVGYGSTCLYWCVCVCMRGLLILACKSVFCDIYLGKLDEGLFGLLVYFAEILNFLS